MNDARIIINALDLIHSGRSSFVCIALQVAGGPRLSDEFAELFRPSVKPAWWSTDTPSRTGYFGAPYLDDPRSKSGSVRNEVAFAERETALGLFLAMQLNP